MFHYDADLADKDAGRIVDADRHHVVSRVVYEPVGLCALITPWNYPPAAAVLEGRPGTGRR